MAQKKKRPQPKKTTTDQPREEMNQTGTSLPQPTGSYVTQNWIQKGKYMPVRFWSQVDSNGDSQSFAAKRWKSCSEEEIRQLNEKMFLELRKMEEYVRSKMNIKEDEENIATGDENTSSNVAGLDHDNNNNNNKEENNVSENPSELEEEEEEEEENEKSGEQRFATPSNESNNEEMDDDIIKDVLEENIFNI